LLCATPELLAISTILKFDDFTMEMTSFGSAAIYSVEISSSVLMN
jgi:hypothetical protein